MAQQMRSWQMKRWQTLRLLQLSTWFWIMYSKICRLDWEILEIAVLQMHLSAYGHGLAASWMAQKMWNRTTAAVMAALTDDEVVQITDLPTLTKLWTKFDDRVQDDAAQFLSELVALAEPQQVITHCYHVDHRQQVHHR